MEFLRSIKSILFNRQAFALLVILLSVVGAGAMFLYSQTIGNRNHTIQAAQEYGTGSVSDSFK